MPVESFVRERLGRQSILSWGIPGRQKSILTVHISCENQQHPCRFNLELCFFLSSRVDEYCSINVVYTVSHAGEPHDFGGLIHFVVVLDTQAKHSSITSFVQAFGHLRTGHGRRCMFLFRSTVGGPLPFRLLALIVSKCWRWCASSTFQTCQPHQH